MGNTYPSVLYKMLIINLNWAVNLALNLAMTVIHENTRQKVYFQFFNFKIKIMRDKQKIKTELLLDFEENQIPKEYGGTLEMEI